MSVMVVTTEDPSDLYDAVNRRIGDIVGHPELHLNSQREKWLYDEAIYGSDRLFAACVMSYVERRDVAIIVVVRGGVDMQVSRKAYERLGGRDFLCGVMSSVRGLRL
ncbi:MAG: hypothetical protein ABL886_02200 [Rhodoglobus sp.]